MLPGHRPAVLGLWCRAADSRNWDVFGGGLCRFDAFASIVESAPGTNAITFLKLGHNTTIAAASSSWNAP